MPTASTQATKLDLTSKPVIKAAINIAITVIVGSTLVSRSVTLISIILSFLFLCSLVVGLKYLYKRYKRATEVNSDSEVSEESSGDSEESSEESEDEEVHPAVSDYTGHKFRETQV